MDWAAIVQALAKIPKELPAPAALASGFILFAPEYWAAKLGIVQIRTQYRGSLGVLFVTALAFLIPMAAGLGKQGLGPWLLRVYRMRKLRKLSEAEKALLRPAIKKLSRIAYSDRVTDAVTGLQRAGVCEVRRRDGYAAEGFQIHLEWWAWILLKQYPDLVGAGVSEDEAD
jgi:hypothetical protein